MGTNLTQLLRYRRVPSGAVTQPVHITKIIGTGTAGQSYSDNFAAQDGFPPYTWAIDGSSPDSLPTGMSLNPSTGFVTASSISGTARDYSITIKVTDSQSVIATLNFTLTINPAVPIPLSIKAPPTTGDSRLRPAEQNIDYSTALVAEGGSGTGYSWSIVSGSLPTGLDIVGQFISGKATGALVTDQAFTLRVTDSLGAHVEHAYTISVVAAIPRYAYWEQWIKHAKILNTGDTSVDSDFDPGAGSPGDAVWRFQGSKVDTYLNQARLNPSKAPAYSYDPSGFPDNAKVTILNEESNPESGASVSFPLHTLVTVDGQVKSGGQGNVVIVYDEYFPTECITAQECIPGMNAEANVATHKWRQVGMNYGSTGRHNEFRVDWRARNKPSDVTESNPRRCCRFDLRTYDDLRANSKVSPLYLVNNVGYTPTGGVRGLFDAAPATSVAAYENQWLRHIIQIRQRIRGSQFVAWSTWNNASDTDGIPNNEKPITQLERVSAHVAKATLVGHDWQSNYVMSIRGATETAYNEESATITVLDADHFTYPTTADLTSAASPTSAGSPVAGSDFDEISWFIGHEGGQWHCVLFKVPWKHSPRFGVDEWWCEHDTSSNAFTKIILDLKSAVVSGKTIVTAQTVKEGSTAITSIVKQAVETKTPTDIRRTGSKEATVTLVGHGWQNGYPISISGAGQAPYNRSQAKIFGVTADTFKYQLVQDRPAGDIATGTFSAEYRAAIATTATPHNLSTTNAHAFVVHRGMDQAEYNGSFDAGVIDATSYVFPITGSPVSPATGASKLLYRPDGVQAEAKNSVRIKNATPLAYNGDYLITATFASCPPFGDADLFQYEIPGSPLSDATGNISMIVAYLNDVHVFIRGFFALHNYDSPGAAALGDGIKDPFSSPADFDADLFQLPKP